MGVKIKGQYSGNLSCEMIHQTGETIQTDAPKDNHGKGESFSPTDLVAAALGSCMITIIAIRSNTKGINLGHPSFVIEKEMQTNPRRIKKIKIEISLSNQINEEQREYLEVEAKSCPVALSINSEIEQDITFIYV